MVTAPFEAARQVDAFPNGHPLANLHGHSFVAKIRAKVPDSLALLTGGEVDLLQQQLCSCVKPLNYTFLNKHIITPTDENIARWISQRLDVPDIETVGVQSTTAQGVDLDTDGHANIWASFQFEAAHKLPNVPKEHKCGRMHGHGFKVILHVDQNLGNHDMVVDFDYLVKCWVPLQKQLHHNCLNDILGLENPTSEMISHWIWQLLKPKLPNLSWITTYETQTAGCHYDGQHYRIWKDQYFESAIQLERTSGNNSIRRLHGHSYLLRLHLSAPLDAMMGWTIDYGDVKELFNPIYKELDHHNLNTLPGLDNANIVNLLFWIRDRVAQNLPQLDRIDLYETTGCGAMLGWGGQGSVFPV